MSIQGTVIQDCISMLPATGERVELVMKRDDRVIAFSEANDRGEFTLRGPHIDVDEVPLYLRVGAINLPLPNDDVAANYFANQLIVPCRAGGSVGRWPGAARTSTEAR